VEDQTSLDEKAIIKKEQSSLLTKYIEELCYSQKGLNLEDPKREE